MIVNDPYRSIFEHAVEGIFCTAPDGTYLRANPALARIYGYDSPEELMTTLNATQLYVNIEQRSHFQTMIHKHGNISHFTSEVYRKDGTTIWISESARLVQDSDGKLIYYEGFVSDITEYNITEQKLRAVFNAMPDLMLTIEQSGIIIEHTEGKMYPFLFHANELCGKHIENLLPLTTANHLSEYIHEALEYNAVQIFEFQYDNESHVYDYEARVVVCRADEVLVILRDITERKKAERLKNEFVSIVSHELRTPLTSIRGSLGIVIGAMFDQLPPKVRSMISIAHKNSERLVSLVNDILDIDKIESGKMVFDMQCVDIAHIVEQAIEANKAYAEQLDVAIVLAQVLDPPATIQADSDRLIQVLSNLLSNAAKFSPAGGQVTVHLSRNNGRIRVAVRDEGEGIPTEFHGRIFQKFAQADSSSTRQKGGTGLGLSISKAIIERHNGTIGFESIKGHGSTFFFDVPALAEQESLYSRKHAKPRILICEDTPDLASMLSIMLSYGGFTSDIAYNTTQAKQLLANNHYAAMTLDLVMPGQSGIDLIRELRQHNDTRHLPIVVVSALARQGKQELESSAFEIVDWIDKPVDHDRLMMAMKRATARQQTTERLCILHIEDDPDVHHIVATILNDMADTSLATTVEEARTLLEHTTFDLIIMDLGLPDGCGLDLLPLLTSASHPLIPVIVFSAQEVNTDTAQRVAATLVKSRTSNHDLLATIQSLVGIVPQPSPEQPNTSDLV